MYFQDNFDDLGIVVIPTGGCGSIKHWVTLDLINKLGKPLHYIEKVIEKPTKSKVSKIKKKDITQKDIKSD